MTSKEALYLLMVNQKKVRDGFTFIDLNTHEKVSIEECYDIVIKDLEILEQLEILKKYYSPFKEFLEEMFEKEHNKDLTKVKEWLENE